MKENKKESFMNRTIKLTHGSLLVMGGSSQKYFSHGVPKDEKCNDIEV